MKRAKKILIIIQRSNGDVLLSSSLVKAIYEHFNCPQIDLLVNDDTYSIAKLIPFIKNIYQFSYLEKNKNKWGQEKKLIKTIFKKYDLSINLTSSDRSVIYAFLSGKKRISAVEKSNIKSWWKKIFLSHYYHFDNSKHILLNNLHPLKYLKIDHQEIHYPISSSKQASVEIKKKLCDHKVNDFLIFHPSTQYEYKVYPQNLRDILIKLLSGIGVKIVITGGSTPIDLKIKKQLPVLPNIIDFIGETSIDEFIALSKLSLGYIGMDTLNMHIAASQNKRIFAIFGPTNLKMWAPWENRLRLCATEDKPIQTYGNVTIFQADLPCVACGKAGCNDNHGVSECLNQINPNTIFNVIKEWLNKTAKNTEVPVLMKKI